VRQQAVPKWVAKSVVELMVAVTRGEGTGVEAAVLGFQVAGKTATAQKAEPGTGRYSRDKYVASFIGFVPANNPEVAISVVLDEPVVAHAGGTVAAPVFRRIAEASLSYLGIAPRQKPSLDWGELSRRADPARVTYATLRRAAGEGPETQELVAAKQPLGKDQVRIPDMTGWPLRRAVNKSIELGIEPRVRGHGLLLRQEPAPGSVVERGQRVGLIFEPAS
jgi:cell division protein FtsI (penicillin-binding protein 3)